MSQTTFPFAPPQAAAEQPQDAAPQKNNRLLYILLGVLGLAVVGTAAWFFLLSGGSSDQAASAPVALPKPKPAASASPKASAVPTPAPKALDASVGVDPFKPLAAKPAPSAAAGTTGGAVTGSPTTGGTTTGGTTTPTNPLPLPTTAPAPAPVPVTGSTGGTTAQSPKPPFLVQLLKLTTDGKSAWLGVNGTPYLAKVGGTFDSYFKLDAISGGCAVVQYGDVVGGAACPNKGLIIP